MAIFEILEDGEVVNTIVADAGFMVSAFPDGNYREAQRDLMEPTTPSYGTEITVLAFRQRFTQAEKAAIEMAALDNPGATQQERLGAASLRAFLADLASSTLIDLVSADTIEGTQQLEGFALLAAGRAAEILTAPVQWIELPASIQANLPEPIS